MENQALIQEAKSKIIWGDDPNEVKQWLREKGNIGDAQVEGLVKSFLAEKNQEIREEGIKKIVIGGLLLSIPIIYVIISLLIGVIFRNIFALTCVPGIYGLIKLSNGLISILKPDAHIED